MQRAAVVQRDPASLTHNLYQVRSCMDPMMSVWAVIKAEAYGHGLLWAARHLQRAADGLAVSCVEEALVLREAGIRSRILVLQGPRTAQDWRLCQIFGLEPVLHTAEQVAMSDSLKAPLPRAWVKLNTGMNRLGFAPHEATTLHARLVPALAREIHWLTHLACADTPDAPENAAQVQAFQSALEGVPGESSLANSAAILSGLAQAVGLDSCWLRPGIMLYGPSPLLDEEGPERNLRAVMTVKAPIIAMHNVAPGAAVGYGGTWTAAAQARVATVAMGYADGYPRHAPSGTPALLHGQICPLVGRVSMDMLAVDVTACPQAQVGDWVTLWGAGLPVERVARAAGTIGYELLTRVAGRLRFLPDV